ncbi:MAG: hypothetical protein WDO06_05490 [Actinomycetota bacterium]
MILLLQKNLLHWRAAWSQKQSVQATVHWWDGVLNGATTPTEACGADIELLLSS